MVSDIKHRRSYLLVWEIFLQMTQRNADGSRILLFDTKFLYFLHQISIFRVVSLSKNQHPLKPTCLLITCRNSQNSRIFAVGYGFLTHLNHNYPVCFVDYNSSYSKIHASSDLKPPSTLS